MSLKKKLKLFIEFRQSRAAGNKVSNEICAVWVITQRVVVIITQRVVVIITQSVMVIITQRVVVIITQCVVVIITPACSGNY
jgi:hypothetical protein